MENNAVHSPDWLTRRVFLSASAVAAATVPLVSGTAQAAAGAKLARPGADPGLRDLLRQIDPDRIKATILKLVCSAPGTRPPARPTRTAASGRPPSG